MSGKLWEGWLRSKPRVNKRLEYPHSQPKEKAERFLSTSSTSGNRLAITNQSHSERSHAGESSLDGQRQNLPRKESAAGASPSNTVARRSVNVVRKCAKCAATPSWAGSQRKRLRLRKRRESSPTAAVAGVSEQQARKASPAAESGVADVPVKEFAFAFGRQ